MSCTLDRWTVDKTRSFADDNGFSVLSFLSQSLGSYFIDDDGGDDDDDDVVVVRLRILRSVVWRKENEKGMAILSETTRSR
jgi:hypothetical protein